METKKINTTYGEITESLYPALLALSGIKISKQPVSFLVQVARNITALKPHSSEFDELREKLAKAHASLDENDKPLVKDQAYQIADDRYVEFTDSLRELKKQSVEVELYCFDQSVFEDVEGINAAIITGILPILNA